MSLKCEIVVWWVSSVCKINLSCIRGDVICMSVVILCASCCQKIHTEINSGTSYITAWKWLGSENTHTHTRLMALCPGQRGWAGTRNVKPIWIFAEASDSEWQWHQLGHMQVCTSLQTDNHASTPPLSFLQAVCPSCCPTNSVKALKEVRNYWIKCQLDCRGNFPWSRMFCAAFHCLHYMTDFRMIVCICCIVPLQCFDAVGSVAGRASSL